MKSNKKKKTKVTESTITTFYNKRIQRINKILENKKEKFQKSKNDLFSDNKFDDNIYPYSNISQLIKK